MLANDMCRCFGHQCERKESCARHVDWKGGERTPRAARLCDYDNSDGRGNDFFIQSETVNDKSS